MYWYKKVTFWIVCLVYSLYIYVSSYVITVVLSLNDFQRYCSHITRVDFVISIILIVKNKMLQQVGIVFLAIFTINFIYSNPTHGISIPSTTFSTTKTPRQLISVAATRNIRPKNHKTFYTGIEVLYN